MRVVILGAGAMGTMYGTACIKAGHEVIFLDGWPVLLEKMKAHPYAHLKPLNGEEEDIKVNVQSYQEKVDKPADFVFVTVKSSQTRDCMESIKSQGVIGENTLVMTFQGGFENPAIISEYLTDQQHCLPACTTSFCKANGPMSIENFGIMESTLWPQGLGAHSECPQLVKDIVGELNKGGLNLVLTPRAVSDRWKLLVFYPTNIAVSAIVHVDFGHCWNTPACQELLKNLAKECALIAKLDGVDEELFNEESAIAAVRKIAEDSPTHAGSMLQDIRNKRVTEIDATNGALLRRAKMHGIALPYTEAIWALVKTVESNYGSEC